MENSGLRHFSTAPTSNTVVDLSGAVYQSSLHTSQFAHLSLLHLLFLHGFLHSQNVSGQERHEERVIWEKLINVFRDSTTNQKQNCCTKPTRRSAAQPRPKYYYRQGSPSSSGPEPSEMDEDCYFVTASWDPYINFFASLFFFVFSVGTAEKLVPNSVLFCGISVFFWVVCFIA
uniref:Uncharacterized protein n=1 Tax=Ditylenchus dipsaci TaxID=166011 RepID=A0A915E7T6_9BILA